MAHLEKLPTYFVRGDERRAAYYTIQARELLEQGFVEEDGDNEIIAANIHKPLPEIVAEVGVDAFDDDADVLSLEGDELLDAMTKAELLEYALEHGVDLKNTLPKAQILAACKELGDA
jgi:hypothetical protein